MSELSYWDLFESAKRFMATRKNEFPDLEIKGVLLTPEHEAFIKERIREEAPKQDVNELLVWLQKEFPDDWTTMIQFASVKKFWEENKKTPIDINQILNGVGDGSRHYSAVIVATWFRRNKKTQEETLALCLNWNENNQPPLSEKEIIAAVNASYKTEYRFFFKQKPTSILSMHAHFTKHVDSGNEASSKKMWGITQFNKATRIYITSKNLFFENVKTILGGNAAFEKTWRIYLLRSGEGQYPFLLFTQEELDTGDQDLYLELLDEEQALDKISHMPTQSLIGLAKCAGYKLKELSIMHTALRQEENALNSNLREKLGRELTESEKKETTWHDFVFDHALRYVQHSKTYTLTLPCNPAEFANIEDHLEFLTKVVTTGAEQYDNTLITLLLSTLPEPDAEMISPESYMPFSTNIMMMTNTSVMKSTIGSLITGEPNCIDFSQEKLLGWSSTQTKQKGMLHQRLKPTFLDEIQNLGEKGMATQIMQYEETGKAKREKGQGNLSEGYSSICYLGNLPEQDQLQKTPANLQDHLIDDLLKLQSFLIVFNKINDSNLEPASKRKAILFYSEQCTRARGVGMDSEQRRNAIKVCRTIAEGFRKEFTQVFLLPEVQKWLAQEHTKTYCSALQNIIDGCQDKKVKAIFKGQLQNYRHARGLAFRLGWLQHGLSDTLNKEWNTEFFLKTCDEWLSWVESNSLQSMERVSGLLSADVAQLQLEAAFKTLKPKYAKIVLYAFLVAFNDKPDNKNFSFVALEPWFSAVRDHLKIKGNDPYNSWKYNADLFIANHARFVDLFKQFGVQLADFNADILFGVLDKDLVGKVVELSNIRSSK